jgi:hypothetical protein
VRAAVLYRVALCLAVLLAWVGGRAAPATAYCTTEYPFTTYDIPVYLVEGGSAIGGFSVEEVAHDLQVAIDNWLEEAGANFRPYYAGHVTSRTLQWNEVNVRETRICDKCDTYACAISSSNGLGDRKSTVWLETLNCIAPRSYTRHTDDVLSFDALLTHELGHAWGLLDEYNDTMTEEPKCENTEWQSAMAQRCPNGRNITRRDAAALQTLYGRRTQTYSTKVSPDLGLRWEPGPVDSVPSLARQSTLGTAAAYSTREVLSGPQFKRTWTNAYVGNTGSLFSAVVPWPTHSSDTWDVAGAALRGTQYYAIATRAYEEETDCRKGVVLSSFHKYAGWRAASALVTPSQPFMSYSEGVSVAHDPQTDLYVTVFVNDSSHVAFQLFDRGSGTQVGFQTIPNFTSYEAPAIACNTVANAGTYNCMVAWRAKELLDPVHYVRVAFSRTDGTSVDYVNPESLTPSLHNYWTLQPPSLTYLPSTTTPFMLGSKQGWVFYTWQYQASTNSFINARVAAFSLSRSILSGTLGVQNGRVLLRYTAL